MKKAPNEIDRQVGHRVRTRRLLLGMSQEKLGEALGLTFQQVQKYEKGTNRISASRLQQIARILDVSIDYLYGNGGEASAGQPGFAEPSAPAYEADLLSADGLKLLKAYHGINDPSVRRRILDLAQVLATTAAPASPGPESKDEDERSS
jgi:transcriptional regulator with XRE-family HTH domain